MTIINYKAIFELSKSRIELSLKEVPNKEPLIKYIRSEPLLDALIDNRGFNDTSVLSELYKKTRIFRIKKEALWFIENINNQDTFSNRLFLKTLLNPNLSGHLQCAKIYSLIYKVAYDLDLIQDEIESCSEFIDSIIYSTLKIGS